MFPSVRLAQSWHETGGNIPDWNNLCGYQVGTGVTNEYWKGRVVTKRICEAVDGQRVPVTVTIRAYDSIYDYYKDQDLLLARSRYIPVWTAANPVMQAQMLFQCGYAADPAYAEKLIGIMEDSSLFQHDAVSEGVEFETAEQMEAHEALRKQVASLKEEIERLSEALLDQTDALKELQLWALDTDARNRMDAAPSWAQSAVDAALRAKLIDTPSGGSYDFYRLLAVLHRKNLI
nr:glucosaminidase domain-containing protein [Paenibacillus montanisoli]